jgi:opacity protein-like surface antigen
MRSIVLLLILASGVLSANDYDLSLSVKGSFTTSTRFTYNIDRVNTFSEERTITSNLGYGADLRWNILWDRFYIGVSGEKIAGMDKWSVLYPQYGYLAVPHQEGFEVTAVELSGYYVVPISSEEIRFYLGGGLGTYDGSRTFSIAGVKTETISSASYMGIHVMTGIDYRLHARIGLRLEIKFRDPHFDVTTKFEQPSAEYQGRRIALPQTEEVTKVNLFGVNYMGGIAVTL